MPIGRGRLYLRVRYTNATNRNLVRNASSVGQMETGAIFEDFNPPDFSFSAPSWLGGKVAIESAKPPIRPDGRALPVSERTRPHRVWDWEP